MNIEKTNAQSVLIMKNLYYEKILFERDEVIPKEFRARFIPEYKDLENGEIEVKLSCQIKSDSKFALEIALIGVFENTEKDEKARADINKYNTLMIMFPYLRSELTLITAQPNFPTINFPVININALVDENSEMVAKTIGN